MAGIFPLQNNDKLTVKCLFNLFQATIDNILIFCTKLIASAQGKKNCQENKIDIYFKYDN